MSFKPLKLDMGQTLIACDVFFFRETYGTPIQLFL